VIKIVATLRKAKKGSDPLALKTLSQIRVGINPKKENVGFATRRLLTNGFKEFFREEGRLNLADCWRLATA